MLDTEIYTAHLSGLGSGLHKCTNIVLDESLNLSAAMRRVVDNVTDVYNVHLPSQVFGRGID